MSLTVLKYTSISSYTKKIVFLKDHDLAANLFLHRYIFLENNNNNKVIMRSLLLNIVWKYTLDFGV